MSTRRAFLKQSTLLSAGLLIHKDEWFLRKKPIGVQLYTLRNEMGKDPKSTLEKVAQIGYKQVETYGYGNRKWFGLNAAELSAELKNNGLVSPSGHVYPASYFLKDGWEESWKITMEDAKAIGHEFIVIPWLEVPHRGSIDNYKKIAEGLNRAGALCKQSGLKLAYHNHDFEFNTIDGQTGFDILTKETDPKLVCFELDLYWAVRANHDPLKLFQQYPGRFALWHVKDMDNNEKRSFTEAGNGIIDFKSIFARARQSGMKYFFVEQDICPGAPLDSIQKSFKYIDQQILK